MHKRLLALTLLITLLLSGLSSVSFASATIERLSGKNRYHTSQVIADYVNANATEYILVSGTNFPDALSGAILTSSNRPVLLTEPNKLSDDIKNTLSGASKVTILGGPSAISYEVEEEVSSLVGSVTRISGKTRYETSAAIARTSGHKGSYILVSGTNYPDALSASALLSKVRSPIILTETNHLPLATATLLEESPGASITIIGGTSAVSSSIETSLRNQGFQVRRISGATRFDTSAQVAREVGSSSRVILTSGRGFADALSVAPLAISSQSPILLSEKEALPAAARAYLNSNHSSISTVNLIGGELALSKVVETHVENVFQDASPGDYVPLYKGRHLVGTDITAGYYDFSSVEGNHVSIYSGDTLLFKETLGVSGVPWITFPLSDGMAVELELDHRVVLRPTESGLRDDRLNTGMWVVGSHVKAGTRGFTSDTGSGTLYIFSANGNLITERVLSSSTLRLNISDGQLILIANTSGVKLD